MATSTFGSFTVRSGFSEGFVYSTGTLVDVDPANDGTKPLLITNLAGAISGNGGARTATMYMGSSSVGLSPASAAQATDTGTVNSSDWLSYSGTSVQYGYSSLSGSCYFARSSLSGANGVTGAFGTFTGVIAMTYTYAYSPGAPTSVNVSPSFDGTSATVTFTAPASTGDSAITGYNVQYATNSGFTTGVVNTVVAASGETISGLTAGQDYYWRVTAQNLVTTTASKLGGAWSSTVLATQPQPTTVLEYFDGSFTDTSVNDYGWTGTAHNSTSTNAFSIETGYQYVGFITDWDLQYDLSGDSTAKLTAADGFTLLANQTVPNATQPLEQTGVRINRLLNADSIQWPAERRNIATGNRYLTTDTTSNENALEYFQQISLTELGELFVAKNGYLTYRDSAVNNPSPADVVVAFADDGTGVRYESIQVEYGSEQLTNRFTVTWSGGDVQDNNISSQALYGVVEDSATTLAQNLTDATSLAGFYVSRFGQPLYRITELSMNVRNLSSTQRADVLDLELGDVVSVTFTPNGVGSAIVQYAKVSRISQGADPGLDYFITFGLETFSTFPLVLGDAEYGKIGDSYVLGF